MSPQLFLELLSRCFFLFGGVRLWRRRLLEVLTPPKVNIHAQLKIVFGVGIAALLASGAPPPALADELAGDGLSPAQIFKHVGESYASLTTYSDEGCLVIAKDGDVTVNFTTRLARTKFYRIEWKQTDEASDQAGNVSTHGVWSSGAGDFLQAECGVQPQGNREIALAHAAALSGGATATIPRLFFNLGWGDQGERLDDLALSERRQADEKMGNMICYVFTGGSQGRTNTLWIGKQDFLVHQVRTVINAEAMRKMAVSVSGVGPELFPAMHGFTLTETHTNIVLNRKFSRADFIPSFPCFQSSNDE
jgi:hypothetical protein